jgi:hypothetical protein
MNELLRKAIYPILLAYDQFIISSHGFRNQGLDRVALPETKRRIAVEMSKSPEESFNGLAGRELDEISDILVTGIIDYPEWAYEMFKTSWRSHDEIIEHYLDVLLDTIVTDPHLSYCSADFWNGKLVRKYGSKLVEGICKDIEVAWNAFNGIKRASFEPYKIHLLKIFVDDKKKMATFGYAEERFRILESHPNPTNNPFDCINAPLWNQISGSVDIYKFASLSPKQFSKILQTHELAQDKHQEKLFLRNLREVIDNDNVDQWVDHILNYNPESDAIGGDTYRDIA